MRRETGGLGNEAFTSNPILSGLKTTKCRVLITYYL